AAPLRVRHFAANDSIFLGDSYLIKGVAGAILWKLLRDHRELGRTEFSNRELRLDPALRLPDVSDNLEARLLLLQRRLAEQGGGLRMEKTGRGRFRLVLSRPVELVSSEVAVSAKANRDARPQASTSPRTGDSPSARASLAHSAAARCGRAVSTIASNTSAGALARMSASRWKRSSGFM
ncbi:MAG TPA: hypothetical protein VGD76_15140, partial [Ramlibacter sp.]